MQDPWRSRPPLTLWVDERGSAAQHLDDLQTATAEAIQILASMGCAPAPPQDTRRRAPPGDTRRRAPTARGTHRRKGPYSTPVRTVRQPVADDGAAAAGTVASASCDARNFDLHDFDAHSSAYTSEADEAGEVDDAAAIAGHTPRKADDTAGEADGTAGHTPCPIVDSPCGDGMPPIPPETASVMERAHITIRRGHATVTVVTSQVQAMYGHLTLSDPPVWGTPAWLQLFAQLLAPKSHTVHMTVVRLAHDVSWAIAWAPVAPDAAAGAAVGGGRSTRSTRSTRPTRLDEPCASSVGSLDQTHAASSGHAQLTQAERAPVAGAGADVEAARAGYNWHASCMAGRPVYGTALMVPLVWLEGRFHVCCTELGWCISA